MTPLSSQLGVAPTVLVVEDDLATRRLYKFLLNNAGYTVVEAEDGLVALERLAEQRCTLVLTDYNMPRMNGVELTQAIRRDYGDLYVILVTAFGTPDMEKQVMRAGANEYLTKPFDFDDLQRRVIQFFQQQQARVASAS